MIVRRDEADPANRIDGLGGGVERGSCDRAGFEGRGARWGSGLGAEDGLAEDAAYDDDRGWDLGAVRAAGVAFFGARLGVALAGGLRGVLPRACADFLDGLLEELTHHSDP